MITCKLLQGCAALLLLVLAQAGLAFSIPILTHTRSEVLVESSSFGWNALVLVNGNPHVVMGGPDADLTYTWFDGFSWQAQRISEDRIAGPIAMVHVGTTLHIAAHISEGGEPPELKYRAVQAGSGALLTGSQIGDATRYAIGISANLESAQIVYQRSDSSVWLTTFDRGGLVPLPIPPGGELRDAVTDRFGVLWIAYVVPAGPVVELRALGVTSTGSIDEFIAAEEQVLAADFSARIAIANNNTPLVAYLSSGSSGQRHRWLRRIGTAQWSCPLTAADCELAPRLPSGDSETISPDFAIGNDNGGSYVSILARRPEGRLGVRRVYFLNGLDGPVNDEVLANVDETQGPAGSTLQVISGPDTISFYSRSGLLLGMPERSPWRRGTALPGAIESGLALAVDPRGEVAAIGYAGEGLGLRRARWDSAAQRFDMNTMMRPQSERYVAAEIDFVRDGTLHALAVSPAGGVVHLEHADPFGEAVRTGVSSLLPHAVPSATPQIAADSDDALLASWQEFPDGPIHLARRAAGSTQWQIDTLPGTHPGVAEPQLALTGTGLVLVSAYDATAQRIRVWQRASTVDSGPFELRMETPAVVNQAAHDLAGSADGRFALAYVRSGIDDSEVAFRYLSGGNLEVTLEQILPGAIPNTFPIRRVRLALVDGSPSDVRIAYTVGNGVDYARRTATDASTPFEVVSLGTLSPADQAVGLGLASSGSATYVAGREFGSLEILRHDHSDLFDGSARARLAATVNVGPAPTLPGPSTIINPIAFCLCGPNPCQVSIPPPDPGRIAGGPPPFVELESLLMQRFNQTPTGQRYLELFYEHGVEVAALILQDPYFAAEFISVRMLYEPGLRNFVEGNGSQVSLSPEMLERGLTVWQYWADNGSPELRADIELEMERTDNLQLYAGMTFDQWFAALPDGSELFRNGFEDTAP